MPNMLQTSAVWLGEQLQAHAGRSVTVRQGTKTIAGITAAMVMSEHEVFDAEGFPTKIQSYDWTLVAGNLGGLELRSGAEISEMIGVVRHTYEVVPVGKRPCVENLDTSGILLTVHTKKVK